MPARTATPRPINPNLATRLACGLKSAAILPARRTLSHPHARALSHAPNGPANQQIRKNATHSGEAIRMRAATFARAVRFDTDRRDRMAARPVWRGHLRLALVTCPVALHTVYRASGDLHFYFINPKTGHRVRMVTL